MGEFQLCTKFLNSLFKIFYTHFKKGFNTKRRELMGRKRKFGEESDFVSVRVPKSKRKEYRKEIREFVENKFAKEQIPNNEGSNIKNKEKKLEGFRKFEEFIKDVRKEDKEKESNV